MRWITDDGWALAYVLTLGLALLLIVFSVSWSFYQMNKRGLSAQYYSGHCYRVIDLGFGSRAFEEIACPP